MLRRFALYYRPHLPLFFLDFFCAVLMSVLDLVFPLAVRQVIDDILPAGDIALLLWAGAGLLVMYLVNFGLQYIVEYYGHVLGAKIEYDMRRELFEHVQKLSFRYFDNTRTGHLMSRVVNDLFEISEFAHHAPEGFFIVCVTMLGSFLILLTINWQLSLITFLFVPFLLWFTLVRNKQLKKTFQAMRLTIADINAQVEDSITGIRLVKAYTNEAYEQEKFMQRNNDVFTVRKKALRIFGSYHSGINFMTNLIHLVVLIAGAGFIYLGRLTVGEFIGFLLYIALFFNPIRRIALLTEMYQKGMAGFRRFTEVMDLEPDIVDAPDARQLGNVKGKIEFRNVTFRYNDKKQVLENISLTVPPGTTVAFVGPSGGGKTTLCSLIPRFYEVEQGSILIDGLDIRTVTQKSLRENVGIVQQDVFLFYDTIRANIAYGRINASDEEIIEAARKANAHEFITELEQGYNTYIGERGVKLSGGQKQRIAIARMFLKNPPILILDEATSALDNEAEYVIQQALNKLSRDRTTLVIAHRLATIRNADRIVVLTDEGIIEQGTHMALLKNEGLYARLYAAQFNGNLPDTIA
ncbi:ABC transporter ATP-binding protein [Sporomusa sp. GT1]|uniref:ABC transporter ATP-binding protein n=1 Tax=Sporomusa sp. GT1 TaxID=1534747 RepID=UPI00166C3B02|nr:ABC transporter ATP-binding protein [Sporomusa sp. GT1]